MKLCTLFLAVVAAALPMAADCNPAVRSKGLMSGPGSVELAENVCPMTVGQKGELFLRHSYSPLNLISAAASAGVLQGMQDRTQGFGQGWDAYGSRFGAALANRESSELFKTFVLSSVLRMDPRYFRKGSGSGGSRFGYAISRVVVGRTDGGHATFNAPEILGTVGSAGLSNLYYPDADRTAGRTLTSAAISLAADAGWNVLKEFGPEIMRKFHHKHNDDPAKKDMGNYGNVPRP